MVWRRRRRKKQVLFFQVLKKKSLFVVGSYRIKPVRIESQDKQSEKKMKNKKIDPFLDSVDAPRDAVKMLEKLGQLCRETPVSAAV